MSDQDQKLVREVVSIDSSAESLARVLLLTTAMIMGTSVALAGALVRGNCKRTRTNHVRIVIPHEVSVRRALPAYPGRFDETSSAEFSEFSRQFDNHVERSFSTLNCPDLD